MRLRSQLGAICLFVASIAAAQSSAPLPDPRQLMRDVVAHQKQLEKVRENYTYSSQITQQDLDSKGNVTKTETTESENFFVNGHAISRTVKKDGKPLSPHDEQKETERVTKQVQKAEKLPPDQPLEGQAISISRILDIMDVGPPRRETFRNRSTIVFDFVGRKDAKAHGIAEEASKKLKGTMWIDEADREVAHLEVTFYDNFHIAGGLLANIQKGTSFRFDQAPVDGALWLPTGGEGNVQLRVVMVKGIRQHFTERNYDYKRFSVETQQNKDAKVVGKP
ncbi:hypothetical protein [Occallatibacter riparius]|uniref:Uncharacterized protein n=1 Tax=Occallatibacter riparius TaxID=1002689 RepID=A0A9J7BNT2_9BACT|nr:hypothetical protein [Occallatibacter riparius]UWZ84177.1 hypothetical protein MOP44_26945 [Occallatibacter riparius]